MGEGVERQMYYPEGENVPLSVAVTEAIRAHDQSSALATHTLYDHINPDALDDLFAEGAGTNLSVRFLVDDTVVSIWSDDNVTIRVSNTAGQ